jgi:hexosaminidase
MSIFRQTTPVLIYTTVILLLTACFKGEKTATVPSIIPVPTEQIINKGLFLLDSDTKLTFDEDLKIVGEFFKSYVEEGSSIKFNNASKNSINFKIDISISNDEGYELKITNDEILISAKTQKGAFYAFQSLKQLLPTDFENSNESEFAIQCLEIRDAPRFGYRGMHLDVARHFFSVDFIKKYIDLMAMLKMNTFHWHLTEDQGWRIEIKKYPKLQEIAAYRNETLIGHYSDQPHKFDGKKYGGFYTQEEIKDVVKYALERQITVIPEIEMPGHAQAAIAAYPELGCTSSSSVKGKQVEVATKWGVFDEIYCPKESTFKFLEDVIDEVVDLFPGKYIHIGGDEAPKTRWENCTHCQKLIKEENLKDEHGLQSYFITRMEKYINSKGKQIIGWDEILEGGLAPNATVMSWRGNNGAIEAAKQKHDVILTPQSHCYFDHYQSTNENEPLAIGGFLPLEKVYRFNPIPEELTKEQEKYVLGAQGNIWTEYMPTSEKVEYMAFPRMIALSEVVWSSSENKNYKNFVEKLEIFNERLDAMNVNYANHIYEVTGELINDNEQISYQLETTTEGKNIRFTTDNSNPNTTSNLYSSKIKIDTSLTIKAAVFNTEGKQLGSIYEQKINLHKAVGKNISLSVAPHKSYNSGGKQALINGISGNNKRYGDKEWLGFNDDDLEITIEFDKPTEINKISTRFHNGNGQWIYAPKKFNLQLKLNDGRAISSRNMIENNGSLLVNFSLNLSQFYPKNKILKTKSLKITIPNYGIIPEERQGAGHKAWLFIDEIILE